MSLGPGTRIGTYEILELVGAGGMGEVYRARDTKLKRDVALKVLPDAFSHDADRLARFQREAELLATLNHPCIAAVYGIADTDERIAIVLELVEGDTLADIIARGPIAADEALAIAKQVVEALEAAHDRGVIHRDLKPANIKVAPDGTVKVLDFGLAKIAEPSATSTASPAHLSFSPTLSVHATIAGVVLGTAAYMSPEQARGKPVDRRTDIWAFGCVLYEMLTGKPIFGGETLTDTVAAIIKNEPDWSALPADTPPRVAALLRRCLRKDVRQRLPHIGVARLEIEEAHTEGPASPPVTIAAPASRVRTIVPWTIAAIATIVALALGVTLARRREPVASGTIRFTIAPPDGLTFGNNVFNRGTATPAPHYAPSPNGEYVAFVAYKDEQKPRVWVRRLDATAARELSATDDAAFPFWSPDSRFIGFFAQGKLKKIDASGGPAITICDARAGEGGTWNADGVIVFSSDGNGGLSRVLASGGVASPATTLDASRGEVSHLWPQFLPDGRHFLYLAMSGAVESAPLATTTPLDTVRAIYVGSLDSPDRTLVLRGTLRARYASGRLLFLRDSTLMAQPFDATAFRLTGEPVPIVERIASNSGNGRTAFDVSDAGALVYRAGMIAAGSYVLSWLDRAGKRLGSVGTSADYIEIHLSPKGNALAALVAVPSERTDVALTGAPQIADLWIFDLERNGISRRVTVQPNRVRMGAAWSPDGERIAFGEGDGLPNGGVYQQAAASAADAEQLLVSPGLKRPTSWSPDGRFVVFTQIDRRNVHRDVWLMPTKGDLKPTPFLQSTFNHENATVSPDGRWLAFASDKGGSFSVYVRAFPFGNREWSISPGDGNVPQWRADGRELFYWSPAARALMSVPINPAPSFEPGTPVKLFGGLYRNITVSQFAAAPDGQRFLFVEGEGFAARQAATAPPTLDVVTNWTTLLNK